MKADLKIKYLQYLNQKKQAEGFTLIELLVVIIIIGILAAIALPSFLSQANKGKQSEAKTYIGSLNKAQQANFTEKSAFAGLTNSGTQAIQDLGVGIKTQTVNYKYAAVAVGTDTTAYASSYSQVVSNAPLKNYYGFVSLIPSGSEYTSVAVLCEDKTALSNNTSPGTPGTTQGASCDTTKHNQVGGS